MPANFTKKAILEAFVMLAEKKPLSKITVKDIVDECGINRNTFYYHFQDIYALVEEYFLLCGERILKSVGEGREWSEVLVEFAEGLVRKKTVVLNFYKNIGRDQLLKYIYIMTENFVSRLVRSYPEYEALSEEDASALVCFYANGYCGLVIKWIDESMKEEPRTLVSRCVRLFVPMLHESAIAGARSDKDAKNTDK